MGPDASDADKTTRLAQIAQRESGGNPTILNYVAQANPAAYGMGYTASGKYQIVNSTWADGKKLAGLDPSQYPTAASAPEAVQDKVARALFDKYGEKPWATSARGYPAAQPTAGTATATAPAGQPGVQMGGTPPAPPGGPPGAATGAYTGGGIGSALNPVAVRGSPIPAGKFASPVPTPVAAIQSGIQTAQATPVPPGTVQTAGPGAGTPPAAVQVAGVEPPPQPGWGSAVGSYGGGPAAAAAPPAAPPPARQNPAMPGGPLGQSVQQQAQLPPPAPAPSGVQLQQPIRQPPQPPPMVPLIPPPPLLSNGLTAAQEQTRQGLVQLVRTGNANPAQIAEQVQTWQQANIAQHQAFQTQLQAQQNQRQQQELAVWNAANPPSTPRLGTDRQGNMIMVTPGGGVQIVSPADPDAIARLHAAETQGAGTGTEAAKAVPQLTAMVRDATTAEGNIDYGLNQLHEAQRGGMTTGLFAPWMATAAAAIKSLGGDPSVIGVTPEAVSNIQTAQKTLAVVGGAILQNTIGKGVITDDKVQAFIHTQPGIETDPNAIERILTWARSQFTYQREMGMSGLAETAHNKGFLPLDFTPRYITQHGPGPIFDVLTGEMKQPDGQQPSREPPAKPPPLTLPPEAAGSLKEGTITHFGNGQNWTLRNGQPVQVK
jgi:hypothetical protein